MIACYFFNKVLFLLSFMLAASLTLNSHKVTALQFVKNMLLPSLPLLHIVPMSHKKADEWMRSRRIFPSLASLCFVSCVFLYLQDDVVVKDVQGVVQWVNGQVCWPLQPHLRNDKHLLYISVKKKKSENKRAKKSLVAAAHKSQLQVIQITSP